MPATSKPATCCPRCGTAPAGGGPKLVDASRDAAPSSRAQPVELARAEMLQAEGAAELARRRYYTAILAQSALESGSLEHLPRWLRQAAQDLARWQSGEQLALPDPEPCEGRS